MIYLVRHGQTEWNEAGIMQGWLNSPLTKTGEQQAQLVANFLDQQASKPEQIICSSLGRTIQTAEIIANKLDLQIETFNWLREINVGRAAHHTRDWIDENYPDFFPNREHNPDNKFHTKYPGGESFYDVYQRLKNYLPNKVNTEKNTIIVAHSGVNRIIRSLLLNKNPADYIDIRQKNNEVVMIDLVTKTEKSVLL